VTDEKMSLSHWWNTTNRRQSTQRKQKTENTVPKPFSPSQFPCGLVWGMKREPEWWEAGE